MVPTVARLLFCVVAAHALEVTPATIGRRGALRLLGAAAATGGAPLLARADVGFGANQLPGYDEEGRLIQANGYSEETAFRKVKAGVASVDVLGAWRELPNGGWEDPTLGSATNAIEMRAKATSKESTKDLGKPEYLDYVKTLELEEDLRRADLVAAAVRKADGITFYDFDLALPAVKCDAELATACLPNKVILLSCGVRDGQLHVMRVEADPGQWKRCGRALRELRSSFSVDAVAA